MYNLKIHLQRIDEKMALLSGEISKNPENSTDLQDEKAVTEQCLRICEDAKSYLDSVIVGEPSLQDQPSQPPHQDIPAAFEAQKMTRKAIESYRDGFVETIGRLRERLENLNANETPHADVERARLQNDIDMSNQCLEVCKFASNQISSQKIHTVGEAVVEEDSDQMVVTTLADLFDVRKAISKTRSTQLIGSFQDETLQQLSKDRYGSRFGMFSDSQLPQKVKTPVSHQQVDNAKQPGLGDRKSKVNANEVKKRTTE